MLINYFNARIYIALIGLLCLAGCSFSFGEREPESITFMAGFRPQANLPFVAAYVAQEKGYFEEQGLNVDIQHSTGEHLNLLMAERSTSPRLTATLSFSGATTPACR